MNITSQRVSLPDIGFWLIIASYLMLMFGSPMPIKIGVTEIAMGVGLTIGVLLLGYSFIARKDGNFKLPALCLAYFLLAPLLTAVARVNSASDMARDIVPLMFMTVLPFIISQNRSAPQLRALLVAILAVGLVSALQFHLSLLQIFGSMDTYLSRYAPLSAAPDNGVSKFVVMLRQLNLGSTDYTASILKCQDPAILFTAIYLLCLGLGLVLIKPRRLFLGLLALGGGAFCAYEFSALGMRAFVGLTLLALIIYALHLVRVRKLPVGNLIVAGILGLILTYNQLINFAEQMWAKQQVAGLSHRHEELYAAFNTISESVTTLLFGIGWGGVLANPIYGGETTRFTHSLISFWLLKTGLLGFAVLVLFVILLCRRINLTGIWTSSHRLAVILAASAAIAIGLIFEPTYKMLSFGMVVGLLLAELALPPAPPVRRH
ncbi:MAG: O-antigen ligase family protein [Cellvibrio sp.]|uniref:O-antigen ligase family protein n=1 Tax=Cellvibrio sp. TaxID=1965322 RepID=UPI002719B8EE|nr:O-antigen ligase family protein [Cellvibrio sp.]